MASRPERLLREGRMPLSASFLELFFDLAFVLALNQLAQHLLEDLTLGGVLRTVLLLTAVLWIWVPTAVLTDWFDAETPTIRIVLITATLGSVLAGAAITQALGGCGLLFAGAYVAVHVRWRRPGQTRGAGTFEGPCTPSCAVYPISCRPRTRTASSPRLWRESYR
ncbi:low temperature requirement protein A [Micromonospora sp. NPDC048947]|uniref:low temperature requirement protein A n=1 Tax=Micromonospora sp. NPDC048947 TaxID=3154826 RepID=UPI0033D1B9FE